MFTFHYSLPSLCASSVFGFFRWNFTPQHTVVSPFHPHSSSFIAVCHSEFMSSLGVIPSVRMESIPLYKHFAVNNRVLLCFITILLSLSCGVVGLIDMCLGFGIGYGLLSLHITYHILQWFPSFIPWAICVGGNTILLCIEGDPYPLCWGSLIYS